MRSPNTDADAQCFVEAGGRKNTGLTTSQTSNNTIGTRQVISYGGNVRYNTFDLSIAPRGDNRTELGAYVQDELFLHDRVRLNVGARLNKFDVIDAPVFSPRVALMWSAPSSASATSDWSGTRE